MNKLEQAARQAIEAMKKMLTYGSSAAGHLRAAIEALNQALDAAPAASNQLKAKNETLV